MLLAQALRQKEVAPDDVEQDDGGCHEKRHAVIDSRQQPTNGRTNHEADARCAPNDAEVLAALLRLGNIGDIAKKDTKVATGQPIDDAAQEEYPERTSQAKEQVANRRTE